MKRGFKTKREALDWERTFLQQKTSELNMTFEDFVPLYIADMKNRFKESTWLTKEHRVVQMPSFLCDEIQDYIKTLFAVQPDDRISCEYGVRTVGLSCSSRSGMHPRSAHKCLYNLAKSAEK